MLRIIYRELLLFILHKSLSCKIIIIIIIMSFYAQMVLLWHSNRQVIGVLTDGCIM